MKKTKKIVVLGIVAVMLAALTVSTASAHVFMKYKPLDNSVPEGECHSAYVEVWANVSDPDDLKWGQVGIHYDESCVNVTDHEWGMWVDPGMTSWNANPACWGPGYDFILFTFAFPVGHTMVGDEAMLVNLTVHCESSEYCETPIELGCGEEGCSVECKVIFDNSSGKHVSGYTLVNGTFECGVPPETYTISGYTTPAVDKVNITNLDKLDIVKDRPADYIGLDGFYNLTLNVPTEVEAGDTLQITACEELGDYESNCNVSDPVVVNAPGEDTNVNLTLNHYCKNYYPTFPFHTWNESNWSGPAVMEMLIDNYRDPPNVPNQTELNETGIGYNQDPCNADLEFVDPRGMMYTLNRYLHAYNGLPYVANYGIGSYDAIEDVLHYICKWHYLGPGTAPAYGNYSNWMVIRGIHTDVKPTFTQGSYEIYGFWINDPKDPGGIGENTYKTVDQWSSTYHLNLTDVRDCDSYKDKYVAVCEPPEPDDVEVTLAKPKPRFADAITPELMEKPLMVYEVEQLALERMVKDDESLKIVKAAIDGVTEELVPYDAEFAATFAKTTAGEPMLVTDDGDDYCIVPFNVPVEVRPPVKKIPVEIERAKVSGLNKLERVERVNAEVVIEPIPIEPIKVERTLVVVLVDAEDGSFKEASWVADPVKYLPVSKSEALKLALGEIEITSASKLSNLQSKPTIELVYRDTSPYYPDWKVTVNGEVFFVSQDGTVSYEKPLPTPTLPPKPGPIQILPI
jgi:hypothetical protein